MTAQIVDLEQEKSRWETLALAPMYRETAGRYPENSPERSMYLAYARADFDEAGRLLRELGLLA